MYEVSVRNYDNSAQIKVLKCVTVCSVCPADVNKFMTDSLQIEKLHPMSHTITPQCQPFKFMPEFFPKKLKMCLKQ